MIDIAEHLKEKEREFISLRELFTRIKQHQPNVTDVDIAKFLLLKMEERAEINNSNQFDQEVDFPFWYDDDFVKRGVCGFVPRVWRDDPNLEDLLNGILSQGEMPTKPMVENPIVETPMDFEDDIPF
ncbi:hypothetical protein MOQ95_004027 [Salmonella enterica]|nr:hypothetical protein [Salmonella enterica]